MYHLMENLPTEIGKVTIPFRITISPVKPIRGVSLDVTLMEDG